ncbi:hypothetical protein L0668_12675 [Paraglaciecola aquimarina]|uniref:Uncharacterized protein n=1 Tax=Paraglaciecola algarum TaxID=3050085 RepID=A0ABS9DAC9_9ALTE|nr:hypothetical protein [Paraglaciecola sp. G1-23]MCF2948968.1 hypothetical protein [Paraglaciecola sp. G1-23]
MKVYSLASVLSMYLLASSAFAQDKEIYLNRDLGFNVEGYNYNQKELPCEVDKYLVKDIVSRGKQQNLVITTVGTGDSIAKSDAAVLAIEIDSLSLGKKGFNFGANNENNVLPAMKVTVGLIKGSEQGGTVLAKHSCAILTINQVSPGSSSVLDMGTYGMSVCDATHKCLNDLSKDIVDWVMPQL